jgi:NitT/TauT family transport system ATP-binding protein
MEVTMGKPLITIRDVHKTYQTPGSAAIQALGGVSLNIEENEFVCVVGPSGCGKTTLLNIIAGLESFDSGVVQMDGEDIVGPGVERGVIFQQYALFPWMTVRKNIEYGMKFVQKEPEMRRYTRQEKREAADRYIKMVNLQGFEDAWPKNLSGGMKQRVAIARSYAVNPKVLLMDEPFGALDAQTRAQLQEELLATWQSEQKTCFFITHDVEEAILLATRVVVMSARPGRVTELVNIELPYPRNQATKLDAAFIAYRNQIWDMVYRMFLEERR